MKKKKRNSQSPLSSTLTSSSYRIRVLLSNKEEKRKITKIKKSSNTQKTRDQSNNSILYAKSTHPENISLQYIHCQQIKLTLLITCLMAVIQSSGYSIFYDRDTPIQLGLPQQSYCGNHQTRSSIATQASKALSRQSSGENHKRT